MQLKISRRSLFHLSAGVAASALTPRPSLAATRAAQARSRSVVYSSGVTEEPATYYDLLEPVGAARPTPMLLIHGGAHTGACYLNTPDGRPGWAHAFVRQGYKVIVPDWPGVGRSGYVPYDKLNGELVVSGLGKLLDLFEQPAIVMTHSMSGAYGWKLLEQYGEQIAKLVAIAPAPPGNIQPAPDVLQETEDMIEVQLVKGGAVLKLSRNQPFVSSRGFVDSKLIGASKLFPRDEAERYAASLIAIPPQLLLERANINGSQLKVDDFASFVDKRMLVMTGTDDIDHPITVDRPIVDWLNKNGAKADFLFLGDRGIDGNGHMMMLESNNDRLAQLIMSWLERG